MNSTVDENQYSNENSMAYANLLSDSYHRRRPLSPKKDNDDNIMKPRDMNIDSVKDFKSSGLKESDMDSFSRPTFSNIAHEDTAMMVKYTVSWINKAENDKHYQLLTEIPHDELVSDAIRDILPRMNQKLAESDSNFSLMNDPTKFEFLKAKRTGHAKLDYPALDGGQVLCKTGVRHLSLVETESDAIIVKNVIRKVQKEERTDTGAMVEPKMPSGKTVEPTQEEETREVVTTICWCIKIKRTVKVSKKERRGDETEASLLKQE